MELRKYTLNGKNISTTEKRYDTTFKALGYTSVKAKTVKEKKDK